LTWDEQICVGVGTYKASSFHGVFRCVEHGNLIFHLVVLWFTWEDFSGFIYTRFCCIE
jgi:hypothetical protein